jgi:hypothetical protein
MVPIPMANTVELPTPVIVRGSMSANSTKSDRTHEMCVEAPESR